MNKQRHWILAGWLTVCAGLPSATPAADLPGLMNSNSPPPMVTGRTLFLKNCAHCHSADAHGDEGPDLHDLDWSEKQIADRIRQGKSGQMTAFADKLTPSQINQLVKYVRELK